MFYAVANYGELNVMMDLPSEKLNQAQTLADLKAINVSMNEANRGLERGSVFLMLGNTELLNTVEESAGITIPLERIDAKVRFKIEMGNRFTSSSNYKFRPIGWRVVNLPINVNLDSKTAISMLNQVLMPITRLVGMNSRATDRSMVKSSHSICCQIVLRPKRA